MEEGYSIKDMIAEFRRDVTDRFDNPNTGVFMRLDKIDTKQGIANGRTAKLELKLAMAIGGGLVILAIGTLLARLYIQDIAKSVAEQTFDDQIKNYDKVIIDNNDN